jgi:hypothetical protein
MGLGTKKITVLAKASSILAVIKSVFALRLLKQKITLLAKPSGILLLCFL